MRHPYHSCAGPTKRGAHVFAAAYVEQAPRHQIQAGDDEIRKPARPSRLAIERHGFRVDRLAAAAARGPTVAPTPGAVETKQSDGRTVRLRPGERLRLSADPSPPIGEHLMSSLAPIPVVDVREGGTLRHAQEHYESARALHHTIIASLATFMRPLVPMLDGMARLWLLRSQSPYVREVSAIVNLLGFPGLWFLNGAYQWCCTALAREEDGVPWLARTLDWHFPGLGRFVAVARMRASAGDYYSVTWPGYVGVLTALAPHRFAAAINQAPLRRRTLDPRLRPFDLAANLVTTLRRSRAIPPDHLLRHVFETARDYADAKRMLQATPVACPVIYTLVGYRAGDRCIIESDDLAAANDWLDSSPQWEGRIVTINILTSREAAENSRLRCEGLVQWRGTFARDGFGWLAPPVLNPCTRIAVEMCPARSLLRATGYELAAGRDVPERVCELSLDEIAN
jgi:hypothetical protein